MDRLNQIINHPLWKSSMASIRELEKGRIFCRHATEHLMDTARLAYIENLEHNLGIPREEIYAAALLHDIGRHLQYTEGIPHHEGSASLAKIILKDCSFSPSECERILNAILSHRQKETAFENDLEGLLYRADKKSRLCLFCPAIEDCSWSIEKKNLLLDK